MAGGGRRRELHYQRIKQETSMPHNPQIHLVSRPTGEPTADNFKLLTLETPALQDKKCWSNTST